MGRQIPQPIEFLLTIPLYAKTPYSGLETWKVIELLYYKGTYDSYCPKCRQDSTFQVLAQEKPAAFTRNLARERLLEEHGGSRGVPPIIQMGVYPLHAQCTRYPAHRQVFIFYVDQIVELGTDGKTNTLHTIEKIGQHPSYGDLHLAEVKRYAHVLTKAQLAELSRAIGLASHDVGIGAFVYLRRIFESLVEEAHQFAIKDNSWNEDAYHRDRMSEKIALLKGHLPTFLVEHSAMYSLLSKGVHELTEEECLRHFETMRIGIELILDEKIAQKQQADKVRSASRAITKAIGDTGA
jgi:hypothetical protein